MFFMKYAYIGLFCVVATTACLAQPNITAAEYFFNTDPGPGNGTPLSITPGTAIDLTNINIPTTSLAIGWHTLHVRARDANNVWGFYESRQIYIRGAATPDPTPIVHDITQAEFFYDTDNGPGTGAAIPVTAGQTIDLVNTNFANSLSLGWHTVHVRTKNANNVWGFYESRQIFVRGTPDPLDPEPSPIVELEWFVDEDPGAGLSTTKKTINPSQATLDLIDEPLDVGVQTLGAHKIYVRAKNEDGEWSMSEAANFTVTTPCSIINAPSATGVNRCDPGTLTLTASGASGGETYRWYATNTSNTPLFTGNPYNTPVLSTNTTFYVTTYNPTTFCESVRTPVTASISGIAKPVLNITGSLEVCEGTTQVLTAPAGFVSYTWSNGLTTAQITVATSGTYSVTVNNGICSSPPSDPFVYTVVAKPAKPTITASSGGSLCGTGVVTLSASSGLFTYTWSTGQSTESIDVSSVGNYTVIVSNASGCQSLPSDAFPVTSSAPAKPSISIVGNTSLCNNSSVDLTAPAGFTNYLWNTGAITQSITTNTPGSYSVIVSTNSCVSPSSDAVVVTNLVLPSQPSIQISGSTALCNGGFVGLSAPTGYSMYVWSNGETSRQIVVTTPGAYGVQVGNAAHCLSPSSAPVIVSTTGLDCTGSVPALPPVPISSSARRCEVGTITLTASGASAGQEYRWYENVIGGASLSSADNFTTEVLTASKDYYVAVFDVDTNLESTRIKVTAEVIVFNTPQLNPAGNLSICEGSSMLVAAPGGFTHYQWTKNTQPFASNTQQTSIQEAGNYAVRVGDGVCYSSPSSDLVITVDEAIDKPSISGTNTICETGSVVLTASSGPAYLWSTTETTASITVPAGTYTVTVRNGSCSSISDPITISTIERPAQPVITIQGKEVICVGSLVALAGPSNFQHYQWSNGSTTSILFVDTPGAYSIQVGSSSNCLSVASVPVIVKIGTTNECGIVPSPTNRAPVILAATFSVPVQSSKNYSLDGLILDEDNNIDTTTLRILNEPTNEGKFSGGKAVLEADHTITFDYEGINFSGMEYITLQVCDRNGLCIQQSIGIDVVGEVLVFNGITPNGDGINDYMLIKFIDIIEGAQENRVSILNRWGNVVFEISDYNNTDRVFDGKNSNGDILSNGTYFYKVELNNGKIYTGYLTLNR